MPYVNCLRCGLVNFTVAYWASLDRCTGCGEPLPRPDSKSPSPDAPTALRGPRNDQELPERSSPGRLKAAARQGPMQVEMPSRPMQAERHDRSGVIWFVLVAGIAASVSRRARLARFRARRERRAARTQLAEDLAQRLAANVRRHDQLLLGAAGLFAASNEVTRDEFSAFANAVELKRRLPEARSIAWLRGRPATLASCSPSRRAAGRAPGRSAATVGGLASALRRARDGDRAVLTRTFDRQDGRARATWPWCGPSTRARSRP